MARWLALVLLACLMAIASPARAQDADADGVEDAVEASVADAHAPVLLFHPSEQYFPTSVDYALNQSVLEQNRVNATPVLVDSTPTAAELGTYNVLADPSTNPDQVYFLNNTGGTIRDASGILSSYQAGAFPKTVYAHVTMDGNQTIVQYWFYYAFNPGTWNNHEGDWEMIQVALSGTEPQWVAYSQHESGERMLWSDVDKDGTHPKVYVALGSHASYLKPYEGTIGISGDKASETGPVWVPTDYAIVNVGEVNAPSPGNEWLRFAGRWGEFSVQYEARSEAGPAGPAYRGGQQMFTTPQAWAADLPIPTVTMLFLNWFLANLFLIFLALLLGILLGKVVRLALLQRKTKLGRKLWPYAHLRPIDRKSIGMIIALVGLVLGLVAFFLPWYVVSVNANAPGFLVTNGSEDLFRVDGISGVTLNPMRPDRATVQVNVLPLPIGILLAITTAAFFLRMAGTPTARKLGKRFITKGIVVLLPFLFVLLVASLFLPSLAGGGDPGSLGVDDFLGPVATSPFGGTNNVNVTGGTATVTWGLGIGAWLLVASGLAMIVAGIVTLTQDYAFVPGALAAGAAEPEPAVDMGVTAAQEPAGDSGASAAPDPWATPAPDPDPGLGSTMDSTPDPGVPVDPGAGGYSGDPGYSADPGSGDAGASGSSGQDWQQSAPQSGAQEDFCPVCGAPVQPSDARCRVCDAEIHTFA